MPFKFRAWLATAALLIVLGTACVGAVHAPIAGPADLNRGAGRYPDLTADELTAGRSLVLSRCGSCHQSPAPESKPPGEWPGQVAEMKNRAHLDAGQTRAVERYLVTMSTAPPPQTVSGSSR